MLSLEQCIHNICPIPEKELDILKEHFTTVNYSAKTIISSNKRNAQKLYFIGKGLMRSYFERNEKETTLWIVWEGDFVIFLPERNDGISSIENIQLLEDSTLYEINYATFKELCDQYPAIYKVYSKFLEDSYQYFENRILNLQFKTAKEIYFELVKNYGHIVQRIPLHILASYLGVTKERLSRIRAEKK